MNLLNLSLHTPAENLALDEALLDWREAEGGDDILRFWESPTPFVALGYICKWRAETDALECEKRGVPILRRASGGGTVLQAPGVLNYALILKIEAGTPTENLSRTNAFVMEKNRAALQTLLSGEVRVRGCTDLALGDRKFNGNAQRRRQKFTLFHGALLLDCDLDLMSAVLKPPPRQPDYRGGRTHADFVTNLHLPTEQVKAALSDEWGANSLPPGGAGGGLMTSWPHSEMEKLVSEKYARDEWNLKF